MVRQLLGAVLGLVVLAATNSTAFGDPDHNLEIMINAARKLEYVDPENRAYLLIKRGIVRSEVGVIFGYGDNGIACEQLASVLSEFKFSIEGLIKFECARIY